MLVLNVSSAKFLSVLWANSLSSLSIRFPICKMHVLKLAELSRGLNDVIDLSHYEGKNVSILSTSISLVPIIGSDE